MPLAQALEHCAPQVKAASMDDLVRALPSAWGEPTARKELCSKEHYLVDGGERRIRREGAEEKAYSLDDEGLPDPMDASAEEKARWRERGSLEFKAMALRLSFPQGRAVEYEETQGRVTKVLALSGEHAIQCESNGCICQ